MTTITFVRYNDTDKWKHFEWLVTIHEETFQYKTGIAHWMPRTLNNKKPQGSVLVQEGPKGETGWAIPPTIKDVIETLAMDAHAGSISFDEFCSDLGFSNDSIKAFDIYRLCMQTFTKFNRIKRQADVAMILKELES